MTAKPYFRIANWKSLDHYGGHKKLVWVKLYYDVLSLDAWFDGDDRSKILIIVCILAAGKNNGLVPNDPGYIRKLGRLDWDVDFTGLVEAGVLIPTDSSPSLDKIYTQSRQNLATVENLSSPVKMLDARCLDVKKLDARCSENTPPPAPPPTVDLFPDPPQAVVEKPERKAPKQPKPAKEEPVLPTVEKKWFVEQWQTQYPNTDPAWEHDKLTWIRMYARLKNFSLEEIRRRWTLYLRKTGSYFDGHSLRTFLERDFDKALESANGNGSRGSSCKDDPPGWEPHTWSVECDPNVSIFEQDLNR